MTVLLLISSSGISMDVHFCQGDFKRANLFGKAKTCAEVAECGTKTQTCSGSARICSSNGDHKDCCKNELIQLDFDFDSGEAQINNLQDIDIKFVAIIAPITNHYHRTRFQIYNLSKYIPPLLIKNIPVFIQSFLL